MAAAMAAVSAKVQNVAIVVNVAVVTRWFLSHLQHLAVVKLRCGTPSSILPRIHRRLRTAMEEANAGGSMSSVQQLGSEWVTIWKNIL